LFYALLLGEGNAFCIPYPMDAENFMKTHPQLWSNLFTDKTNVLPPWLK